MNQTERRAYMLDTNVFNDVLDGSLSLVPIEGHRLLVTGVQASELRATRDAKRRADLLAKFEEIGPTLTLASSFRFGVEGAGFDQATWNDGSGDFDRMLARLQALDGQKGTRRKRTGEKQRLNQIRDVLIAETAIKEGAILISRDCSLCQMISEFEGSASDPSSPLGCGNGAPPAATTGGNDE